MGAMKFLCTLHTASQDCNHGNQSVFVRVAIDDDLDPFHRNLISSAATPVYANSCAVSTHRRVSWGHYSCRGFLTNVVALPGATGCGLPVSVRLRPFHLAVLWGIPRRTRRWIRLAIDTGWVRSCRGSFVPLSVVLIWSTRGRWLSPCWFRVRVVRGRITAFLTGHISLPFPLTLAALGISTLLYLVWNDNNTVTNVGTLGNFIILSFKMGLSIKGLCSTQLVLISCRIY